jgi:hypothetical protein
MCNFIMVLLHNYTRSLHEDMLVSQRPQPFYRDFHEIAILDPGLWVHKSSDSTGRASHHDGASAECFTTTEMNHNVFDREQKIAGMPLLSNLIVDSGLQLQILRVSQCRI